ncbi:MAG: hypothetical protein QXW76_07540 [Candidatus Korarchaeum sp.]
MGLGSLSALVWPLLSQAFVILVLLSNRPSPIVELGIGESLGLSLFYVTFVFLMALLMVYLIQVGKELALKIFTSVILVYSAFLSLNTMLSYYLEAHWSLELVLSVIIAWLSFREGAVGNAAKSILAASMAYLFVTLFNDIFIYFLLAFLTVYDTYSVFKGPLSKLFSFSKDSLRALTIFQGDVGIGLGDVFCYSMTSATSFRSIPYPFSFIPIVMLNLGILITILILRRGRRALPGLTIPIPIWLVSQLLLSYAH